MERQRLARLPGVRRRAGRPRLPALGAAWWDGPVLHHDRRACAARPPWRSASSSPDWPEHSASASLDCCRSQGRIVATALDMRTLSMADAEALSAAFDSIGWDKPAEQFVRYVAGRAVRTNWRPWTERWSRVTLHWESDYPGIVGLGIPEIQDLNVPSARHRIRDARPGGAHGGSAIGDLRHRGGPALDTTPPKCCT